MYYNYQLFTDVEVIIGEYSPIITETEVNICFSISSVRKVK